MRAVFYITNHGYGHASRNVPIIRALARRNPGLELAIKSDAQRCAFLQRNLPDMPSISYHTNCHEHGLVMQPGHATPDVARMRELVEAEIASFPALIARERAFLASFAPNVVVCDIIGWGLAAAASLGIPSLLIGNFTWESMYRSFFGEEIWGPYHELYQQASEVLFYDIHAPLLDETLPGARTVSLVARDTNPAAVGAIRAAHQRPLVFVSVGGSVSLTEPLDVSGLPYDFACTAGITLTGPNVEQLSPLMTNTPDYIAASTYVVAKGGWSTVAEILLAHKPSALLLRGSNSEDDATRDVLEPRGHCIALQEEDLRDLGGVLERLSALAPQPFDLYHDSREEICTVIENLAVGSGS